eukprot:CAMPEP_0119473236 /NCGR_PEP_ID=MMETSP1344-20130328/4970_1 /TAXON_ID=236787 /ORGANISM="Florenciella parvula, Strain CCMP2471" /LENGTH=109 /DNA_ID=CAMNT_0007506307 /DNA_START=60 /DNA_END=389 /DNA_ORIENTATION=-
MTVVPCPSSLPVFLKSFNFFDAFFKFWSAKSLAARACCTPASMAPTVMESNTVLDSGMPQTSRTSSANEALHSTQVLSSASVRLPPAIKSCEGGGSAKPKISAALEIVS